jgi:tape measure domain-containing protein
MQFDNQGFERGVSTTMKSLNKLNESLKMKNATTGLTDVQSGINKLTSLGMGALSSGVDAVSTKFNALNVIAATALMNITNRAIEAGRNLSRKLTIEPITTGFSEYETKMGAIQTILTNTASKGTTMDDVTAALNELNTYADKTIYSFSEMTKNIGTFTAAGVNLEDSVQAIKGIANLGAGSGSDPTQVATGMYQLSQALAAGKVGLQDWNSVVNAGMGGELFKNELMKMAKSMGIYVDKSKPFRETLQDGWLTSEVLLKTLQKFAEDESLVKAATEVKTLTGLIGTMQESVQSGWATSWEHIFGNKEQAAELFTSISDGFSSIIAPSTNARNAMLKFWNEHGGRTAVIEGLSNVVESFGKVLRGIGMAWEMVFPPMTGQRLVELSNKFKDLTEKFKITDQTAGKIGAVFKGFLDTVVMVKDGVVSLIKGISPIKEIFKGMGSNILDATSKMGKFFSGLRESATKVGFFESISTSLSKVFTSVSNVVLNLRNIVGKMLGYLADLDFSSFFKAIAGGFASIAEFLSPVIDSIASVIGTINFDTLFGLVKAGSAIEIVKALKGMFGEVSGVADSAKGIIGSLKGIGSGIKETLESVRETLEEYQKSLQADTLIKIAGAIAILAGSLLLISTLDVNQITTGLLGLMGIVLELVGAFLLVAKFGTGKGLFAMMTIGGTMRNIALGVGILALALKALSTLSPKEIMTGILGLTIAMGTMVVASRLLEGHTKGLIRGSMGLVIFGAALHVMASALEALGSIDAEVMGSGLVALGVLLGELALFMIGAKFGSLGITSATGILILSAALLVLQEAVERFGSMNPDNIIVGLAGIAGILTEIALFSKFGGGGFNLIGVGVGLTIISDALETLSKALTSFGSMSWKEIGAGLTAMAGGLLILGVASKVISGVNLAVVGVGIGIMSASLLLLSAALKSMGNMSWEEIGKGLVVMAGSLTILAAAMYVMSGAIVGAAALVVVAGALAILTPQILMLSQMDLAGVGIALLAMAGAFTVLGLAGLLLTPVVPTLLGLSGAIALLGLGAVACGAGLTMIGTGLAAIGVAVGGSGLLIVEFLKQLINLLPQLGTKLGEMLVNLAKALGDGLAEITKAIETVLMALLTAIQNVLPKVIEVAIDIVEALAEGLARGVPAVVTAAMELIKGVLQGIAANIEDIVVAGMDCVIGFMDGIASRIGDVIQSGIELALSFIEGVADGLTNNKERMAEAVRKVIKAMLTTGVEVIKGGLTGFLQGGKELLGGLVDGIKAKWPAVKEAVSSAIDKAKGALANAGSKLVQAGKDLIQGFINGIASKAYAVASKAKEIASNAVTAVTNFLGINSPSRVFMEIGKYTAQGMAVGLDKYAYLAEDSASGLAENVVNNVKNPLSNIAKLVDGDIDVNPTITPVMDLTNVEQGARRLSDMIGNQDVRINARTGMLAGSVGKIQNGKDNSDVISAIKDLKEGLSNNTSYNINGITYDDGSNITNAVETLVRAARMERRI